MGKKLVIAEKPSVAADIARALGGFTRKGDYFEGKDFVVSSAVGHLLTLAVPEEYDVKKGKWSFKHLPVIPPHFALAPQVVREPLPDARSTFRAYAPRELTKLDAECRGFLLTLEQSGILDLQTRELVIERALAATGDSLSLEQLKLVVLMVLWNQQTPTSRLLAEDLFSTQPFRLPS